MAGSHGIDDGPLFRPVNRHEQLPPARLSDRAVALIVKRAAAQLASIRPSSPGIPCAQVWPRRLRLPM